MSATQQTNQTTLPPRAAPGFVFFIILITVFGCLFHTNPIGNAFNRLSLSYAVVNNGSINIDPYASTTVDEAYYNGHYYTSQAIGASIPAAGVLVVYRAITGDKNPNPSNHVPLYLITLLVVSVPSALAAMLLLRYFVNFSGDTVTALVPIAALWFGSLIFPYSSLFYSYMPALLLCLAAFIIIENCADTGVFSLQQLTAIGLLISFGVFTSYDTALVAGPLIIYLFILLKRKAGFVFFILGALPALFMQLAYNQLCFGSPFSFGPMNVSNPEWAAGIRDTSYFLHLPRIASLYKLLIMPGRGLLWISPFLLFCIPGFVHMFRATEHRRRASLCLGVAALFLYFNSHFPDPSGGVSPGPRYIITALPFLLIPIFFAYRAAGAGGKTLFVALALFSIIKMSVISITDPHVPHDVQNPFFSFALPMLQNNITVWSTLEFFKHSGMLLFMKCLLLIGAVCTVFFLRSILKQTPAGTKRTSFQIIISVLSAVMIPCCLLALEYKLSDAHGQASAIRRGAVFASHNKHEAAAKEFTRALSHPGSEFQLRIGRGKEYLLLHKYQKAEMDFNRALALEPENKDAQNFLALTKKLTGSKSDIENGKDF